MRIASNFLWAAFILLAGALISGLVMPELAYPAAFAAFLSGILALGAWTFASPARPTWLPIVGIFGLLAFLPVVLERINTVQQQHDAADREEKVEHPKYAGKITAGDPSVKLSTSAGVVKSQIEIGDSGTIFAPVFLGQPLFKLPGPSDLTVEVSSDGSVEVSTQVRDDYGRLIAELFRNEWMTAPPPQTWDRNYSKDAVEVIDPKGKVVLQVKALPDRIQLQGEWHGPKGDGVRFVKNPDQPGALMLRGPAVDAGPQIKRMFTYPSALHLGELAPG